MNIPVEVIYRHVHLSKKDKDDLFGTDVSLTPIKQLGHRGQVIYKETITIIGKGAKLEHVRIFGPERKKTQISLSALDAFVLGINAPVRASGDLHRAGTCILQGPAGKKEIKQSVIIPIRHIHSNEKQARDLGLNHGDVVSLRISGRDQIIEQVFVRVHPTFHLELNISPDEAAEFWITNNDTVNII